MDLRYRFSRVGLAQITAPDRGAVRWTATQPSDALLCAGQTGTYVNDATLLADLLAHGLIRANFVRPSPIQELRDLTRTRKQLRREIVQHIQRIQAVLEEANVKLSSVISDLLGVSGAC